MYRYATSFRCMTFTLGTSHTPNTRSKSKSTLPAVRAVTGISKSFMPSDFGLAFVEEARLICGSVKRSTNNFRTAKVLSQSSFKTTEIKLWIIYCFCRFSLTLPFNWNNIGFLSRPFYVWIYLKMWFISVMHSWIFRIITPVFSVTWSFRNHSNMMICCPRNIPYYQSWKSLCCFIF